MNSALTPRHLSPITYLLIAVVMLLSGCAKEVQLSIIKPAEVSTRGIQKVAVGRFALVNFQTLSKLERNGKWTVQEHTLTAEQKNAISNQIRARVISSLSTVPYFDLVFIDEFATLEEAEALQDAIAAQGFKTAEIDAIINGNVWLNVVYTDGTEIGKSNLTFVQGGRDGKFNYDLEVLAYWPYKSVNGTMAIELKLTRLNPTDVVAVTFDHRSYSRSIGGKPKMIEGGVAAQIAASKAKTKNRSEFEESDLVLPNLEQLVADLSESIAAQFIRRISLSQQSVNYRIAPGGSRKAILLIEAGAYEKAIAVLTETLDKAEEKDPDDLYNLALCFEATTDFGLAAISYRDALKKDPQNLLYAQGMGRIDRLVRENQRLKRQLSARSRP